MRLFRRDAHLDIHLMADVVLAVDRRRLGIDIEEAVARQHQRRIVGGLRRLVKNAMATVAAMSSPAAMPA